MQRAKVIATLIVFLFVGRRKVGMVNHLTRTVREYPGNEKRYF
jgi:hypothetical protein